MISGKTKPKKQTNKMKPSNMTTMMVLALGGMMVFSQTPANAQFGGLGKKKSADSGGASIDKDAFSKSVDEMADNLLSARAALIEAKATMASALDIKTDSLAKASEALRAKEGNTSDKVKKLETLSKASAEVDQAWQAKMAESVELSAEAKAKFAEGSAKFVGAVLLEKQQIETIQKLVEQGQSLVKSSSPLEKAGALSIVKPVTTMATMVPGDVEEGLSTLSKIVEFSTKHNITPPKNATDLLGG